MKEQNLSEIEARYVLIMSKTPTTFFLFDQSEWFEFFKYLGSTFQMSSSKVDSYPVPNTKH